MFKQNDPRFSNLSRLRHKAEEQLKTIHDKIQPFGLETDILKVIHELQVYQIELQMQNEELLIARDRAELAEKKYIDLYDFAPSGYLTLTGEGEIMELNYSAARLLHHEREHLIRKRLALFISENTRANFDEFLQKVQDHKDNESCEVTIEKEGVAPIFISIDGVLDKCGKTILLSMVDITKCKQAEETMRQLESERESLKFKQGFMANMSHEIRTPLTGILGMIDIMEDTELSTEQKDYINILKHSGENLKMIINEVLDYSKIQAGKVKLKPSRFSLHTIFCETKAQFSGRIIEGVEFNMHNDPAIPEFIYADKKRVNQLITNLVANAIKFTPQGSVLLSSKLLNPFTSGKQLMIKIAVTDSGIGIPHKKQKKLFVPFSQIDDKETREYEGTGLGLSICKELVTLLGGEIGVESTYHKGSTFWFIFPVQVHENAKNQINGNQASQPSVAHNDLHPHHKLHILFADDKLVNQKVVSLMLTSMGHEVTLASNGQQALQVYESGKFDLILMDIQMPVMDGITATQKLKEKYKDAPPIVGLSASAFEGDREKYLEMGMDDYLTKPVSKEDFKQLIDRL